MSPLSSGIRPNQAGKKTWSLGSTSKETLNPKPLETPKAAKPFHQASKAAPQEEAVESHE